MKQLTCYFVAAAVLVAMSGCAEDVATSSVETSRPATTTENAPVSFEPATTPVPHCEVPCGIYADQMRFEMMLEDTKTIAKAIDSLNKYAEEFKMTPPDAKAMNQVTRWVTAKENHATNTQHIVAQYFLTQRIKPDHKDYAKQLSAAHAVTVAAMKCKQDANADTAVALRNAVLDLYRAYTGKEPKTEGHDEHKK